MRTLGCLTGEWPADPLKEIFCLKPLLYLALCLVSTKVTMFLLFHTQGFCIPFYLKANSPDKIFFCFKITVLWYETLETTGHLSKVGTNSRLLTEETAGWPAESPGLHFLAEVGGLLPANLLYLLRVLNWASPTTTCSLNCQSLRIYLHSAIWTSVFWVLIRDPSFLSVHLEKGVGCNHWYLEKTV